MECLTCPVTDKTQQDAVIDAAIKAAYLDPTAPTSLRAIAEMLPAWIKADHKRVGRRLERLEATGALPHLERTLGRDGKHRRFRRMHPLSVPDDFKPRCQLIAGDALAELRRLPGNSIDCCVTSPPYYLQDDYNDDRQVGQEKTADEYINRLVEVFAEISRLLKRYGTCWINIGDTQRNGDSFLIPHRLAIALHDDGWLIRSEIVIERSNPIPHRQEPFHRTHDMLMLLAKCRGHYCEPVVRNSVWRIPHDWRSVGGHPCPMPVALARDCVEFGSPLGGTVLDPFLGTGTSAIAAIEARRHFVGVELSDYYLSVARKQLQAGQLAATS